ncbi:hypothetical protein [Roseinatronobacter sp. NSM]|uniref:hypothetical protein n=1 Tax=Roseinatronobacter sp. NSM TaxID=3457785 RepID=UPI0040374E7A
MELPEWIVQFLAAGGGGAVVAFALFKFFGENWIRFLINKDLEKTKASLNAEYSSLKSSVEYISHSQSELRSKTISSIEKMWDAILEMKSEFSEIILFYSIITDQEMKDAIEGGNRGNKFLDPIKAYSEEGVTSSKFDRINVLRDYKYALYSGDKLYQIFSVVGGVYARLVYINNKSLNDHRYRDWRTDHIISLVEGVISPEHIELAKSRKVGAIPLLLSLLDAEFLKEARRVMSGSEVLANSLSDVQAVLSKENEKVRGKI